MTEQQYSKVEKEDTSSNEIITQPFSFFLFFII